VAGGLLVALAACSGGGPGGAGAPEAAQTDVYDRTFAFHAPTECSVYVYQRTVHEASYEAEYMARGPTSDARVSLAYSLAPADAHPLRLEASVGAQSWSVEVSQDEVVVVDGGGRATHSFDPRTGGGTSDAGDTSDLGDTLALARCMLPAQTALGAIPAWFSNRRDTTVPGTGDVTSYSAGASPILEGWTGDLSIVDAYLAAVRCLGATDSSRLAWVCG
jgi:hypothetical protein